MAFGTLAFLTRVGFPSRSLLIWQALACFGLGFVIEGLQSFLYSADLEWEDIRDDALGIAIFIALHSLGQAFWQARAARSRGAD